MCTARQQDLSYYVEVKILVGKQVQLVEDKEAYAESSS
jgi:hypothetical protein